MANYHLHTNVHSRGKGHSAVAAAAYRSGEKLYDERLGESYDYSSYRKTHGGVLGSGIVLLEGVDAKYYDRGTLWNGAEGAEKTKKGDYKTTAAISREIEGSLPYELTDQQRLELCGDRAKYYAGRYKTAVDFSIHAPHPGSNSKNYHVHFLLPTRELGPDGFGQKTELELDGKTKKARGLGTGKQQVKEMREGWGSSVNKALSSAGIDARIDHRSFEERGIKREATKHNGPIVTQMEREGIETDRGNENRAIVARNTALERVEEDSRVIDIEIKREERRIAAQKKSAERNLPYGRSEKTRAMVREHLELARNPMQDLQGWLDKTGQKKNRNSGLSFGPAQGVAEHHELFPLRSGGGGGERGVKERAAEQDNAPAQEKAAQAHREGYAPFDVGQLMADYEAESGKADGVTPEPPGEFKAFDVDDLDKSDKAPAQDWKPVDIEALEQAPSSPEPEQEKQFEPEQGKDKGPDYELER